MEADLSLVSICVITYNSSRTVLETLDSIYAQTYPCIELIISDDCSTDDTVLVCKQWLDSHKDRFITPRILSHERNGGVAKNLNKAIREATGEWIKPIAGDDIMLPDCIQDNMFFVVNNVTDGFVFSKIRLFYEEKNNIRVLMDYYMPNPKEVKYYNSEAKEQYQRLLSCCFTPSPPVFIKRTTAIENPYPEHYQFIEDWPYWLNLTKKGVRLLYFDKLTVLYRVGSTLSHPHNSLFVNPKFHQSMMAFFYAERYPDLLKCDSDSAMKQQKEFFLGEVATILLKNRKNLLSRALLFVFKVLIGTRRVQ